MVLHSSLVLLTGATAAKDSADTPFFFDVYWSWDIYEAERWNSLECLEDFLWISEGRWGRFAGI